MVEVVLVLMVPLVPVWVVVEVLVEHNLIIIFLFLVTQLIQ